MYPKFLELLKQTGKTAYRVAVDTGIPESALSMWKQRYEAGKENASISIQNLSKIAEYFNVSLDYFVK